MRLSPEMAEIRFGCGLSPVHEPMDHAADLIAGLTGPDAMALSFPIEPFDRFRLRMARMSELRRRLREPLSAQEKSEAEAERRQIKETSRRDMVQWYGHTLIRWTRTTCGFRERLVRFWGDHFTASGKNGIARQATSPYIEEAIRPNLAGKFGDLLIAAVTHPVMLIYLDQTASIGPNSKLTQQCTRRSGLNENLAREVLELHTLGVEAAYDQKDVRELAELFTGMTFRADNGFRFAGQRAEPGSETVLGRSYGEAGLDGLDAIHAVLQDLAVHPDTARHIAGKLAVHFVSDQPDPALVEALAQRFLQSGGDLGEVYAVLLEHPAAQETPQQNVKPPFDFVASACRALAIAPQQIEALDVPELRRDLMRPMAMMGQHWQRPAGPDGWSESDAAWITPQGLAARMRWALSVPKSLRPLLPDPRRFARSALGAWMPEALEQVAAAAESRSAGVGLVLASPAFQRR